MAETDRKLSSETKTSEELPSKETTQDCSAVQELTKVLENFPLELTRSKEFGRFLVAARDVKEGEVLLREAPLILGPQIQSAPICLGCHKPLGFLPTHVCTQCGSALLCGRNCEKSAYHEKECEALKNAHPSSAPLLAGDDGNWQVILPLRCFVNQPKGIFQLESHVEDRKKSGAWTQCERTVVSVLHDHGLLRNLPSHAIQRICGVLDVNSFEVRGPPDETGRSECLRGIYPSAAFMAHSCVANTHVSIGNDYNLIIKAATNISKGEPVFHNYAEALMGTVMRRECLKMGKYFSCECKRCKDPTELGSHLSSVRCPTAQCAGAVVSDDPMNQIESDWRCDTCGTALSTLTVLNSMQSVQRDLAMMDRTNAAAMEELLTRLLQSLHPHNSAVLEVTQALSGLYREQLMDLGSVRAPSSLLKRKLDLCSSLLPVVEKIEPPLSRLRGITLYEMASPLAALAYQELARCTMAVAASDTQIPKQLEVAELQIREAARLLLHEPPGAPEAQLARVALIELRDIVQERSSLAKAAKKAASKTKAAGRKKK